MTLGNMRANGVRTLAVYCGGQWCHHGGGVRQGDGLLLNRDETDATVGRLSGLVSADRTQLSFSDCYGRRVLGCHSRGNIWSPH